jgi:O-antigen/teichoic acid export membrane protein
MLFNFIKKHAFFGFIFTVAKATVYFVPLLLADVLSGEDFGVLEYALAGLGMIVNTIINLGVPGAYPYFLLREKKEYLQPVFRFHAIILLVPFVINQILYVGFNLDVNFYLAFNISFIIANQVLYSTQLKSHEKSIVAVILDSGIYLILFLFFILSQFGFIVVNIRSINICILVYSLFYIILGVYKFLKHRHTIKLKYYREILNFSIHLLIATFLIFLITTSGRILVEIFFDFTTVGVYAFYFRLAAIVVMIHQVINIAFFKKIYTFDPKILDKYYYIFFIFIYVLSVLIFILAPYIVTHFSEYFNETYTNNKDIYFLLSAQMVMWIASALNSNIVDRENLASKNNLKFLVLVVLSSILLILFKDKITLPLLTYFHFTIIFVACMIQYYSLYTKNIRFSRSWKALSSIYLLTTFIFIYCFND